MTRTISRNSIVIAFQLCLLLLLFLFYFTDHKTFEKGKLFSVIIILLSSILCFLAKKDTYKILQGQYLTISNLFILGFVIVHFQFYIDLLFGNFDLSRTDLIIDRKLLVKSATISSIALTCFFLGYLYKLKKNDPKNFAYDAKQNSRIINLIGVKVLMILLFIIFIISTPFSYFRGGHITVEIPAISQYSQSYFILVSIGYLILNTRNIFLSGCQAKNLLTFIRLNGYFLTILLGLFCFLIMMSGDRGPILQIVLSYVACYCILNRKKFNIFFVVISIFLAASVVSFLSFFRHFDGTGNLFSMIEQSSEMKAEMVSSKRSMSPSTFELSKSVRIMHASVSYTETYGHTYGVFQGFQIISIVPGAGLLIKSLYGIDDEMLKSSRLLTQFIGADHGLGTTVVADLWLDFGIIGIVLAFLFFGFFLRRLDEYTYSHLSLNILWYILVAIFLSKAFYIGRSTIIILFREVVFAYIILLIGIYLVKITMSKIKTEQ